MHTLQMQHTQTTSIHSTLTVVKEQTMVDLHQQVQQSHTTPHVRIAGKDKLDAIA
jgi:hypothetical protein